MTEPTPIWKLRKWYKEKSKDDESDATLIFWGVVAVIVIIFLWLLTMLIMMQWGENYRGTFGDMFGTINALFSGFAFAGIIFTILLQRKELKLQREELIETRAEFNQQNATLRLQRFENTLFSMLSTHHDIVANMKGGVFSGRETFKERWNLLVSKLGEIYDGPIGNFYAIWEESYLKVYSNFQYDLGHYFRHLYRMVKIIDETDLTIVKEPTEQEVYESKYKYTSMIRAQLSDFELLWLAYNCKSKLGIDYFKPYIEKYALLKNLPDDKLFPLDFIDDYSKGARNKQEFTPPSPPQ